MRFESVAAHSFGPFRNERLELTPGMNVIYGSNEAGKSTWHAALFAGLCGVRRGKGQPRREDRDFEDRHRPWDGDGSWEVGAVISLEDGRRVELRHDLAHRIDSSARDADIAGRDYSNEIMFDGAPDGSRWLGFNRRSFLSTACVRQADILGVLDQAGSLQEELQRAAATAGTDATAAGALELLRLHRSENVGTERAWTKPLLRAHDGVASARSELEAARAAHEDYLDRQDRIEELEERGRALSQEGDAARAVIAETAASEAEARLNRVQELHARFPRGAPPFPTDDDRIVEQVSTALEGWRIRSTPRRPTGPSIPELEEQLRDIERGAGDQPPVPVDLSPDRSAVAWLLVATAGLIAGVLVALGLRVPGAVLAIAALGLFTWWWLHRSPGRPRDMNSRAARVAERRHVEHLMEDRLAEERQYEEDRTRATEAAEGLTRAALVAGVQATDTQAQIEGLLSWQQHRLADSRQQDQNRSDWDELQRLLGEQSLEDLTVETEQLRASSRALTSRVDRRSFDAASEQNPTASHLTKIESQVRRLEDEWNAARGQLEQFAEGLRSVADAEESLAVAQSELDRVEQLDRTLSTTINFLERAEDRVHHDLAPMLRTTVLEWLPRLTANRYTDCRVDPESLAVEVSGPEGHWRRAELLSHGTAEQLYLLLRLALVRHLTVADESSPLILDDAVAACDAERKHAVLETLKAIGESVQVILFTHEEDVRTWARERLSAPLDRLTELNGEAPA